MAVPCLVVAAVAARGSSSSESLPPAAGRPGAVEEKVPPRPEGASEPAPAKTTATTATTTVTAERRSADATDRERPNIVLLIGDDHGFPYFGFMGSEVVRTPNLDSLAAGGTVFPLMLNTASLCAPSLNTLLTGLHPVQWKGRLKTLRTAGRAPWRRTAIEQVATLPRLLGQAGYVSFQAGKFWEGTARMAGFTDGTVDEPLVALRGGDRTFGRETLQPALDFIDESAGKPFFLWFAPMLPHTPFDAPERYLDLYRDANLSEQAKRYYANCSWFDDLVGRLMRHLDERGLRERTLVVYLSDNGWEQAPAARSSGKRGKGTLHEMGLRSPLVFHWPGRVPAGRFDDRLVSSVDLFPTLADYGGVAVPPGRDGIDLRPLIEGRSAPERTAIIGMDEQRRERGQPREVSYYLRDRRWHYIRDESQGVDELYDKKRDPGEKENVAEAHPDVIAELRRRIRDWEREVRASVEGPAASPPAL